MDDLFNLLPSMLRDGLAQWEGAAQWKFFERIFDFIDEEIKIFQSNVLNQMLLWISGIALALVTLWILWQGYQVMQGKARNAMELMLDSTRAAFIITLALTMTLGNADIYTLLSDGLPKEITLVMTGESESAGKQVDRSMDAMEVAMLAIDALNINAGGNGNLKIDQDRAMWMAGVGVAGPTLVGGALQVMYKMGLALFVGLGPLFILCLLFKQTQALFQKWLLYGVGTMFSYSLMAFMAVMVSKIVLAVAGVFAAAYAAAAMSELQPQSVSSMAMMQGGIGLLLTLSLVMVPPVAAYFFQGTLGSYMAYSAFGGNHGAGAPGQRPGEAGYRGQPAPAREGIASTDQNHVAGFNPGSRVAGAASPGHGDAVKVNVTPNRLQNQ
jgi:type IV secretion system protein VirB6